MTLSLSIFVDKQTVKALADTNGDHLDSLIDINKNLAEGLMTKPAQQEQTTAENTSINQGPDISV